MPELNQDETLDDDQEEILDEDVETAEDAEDETQDEDDSAEEEDDSQDEDEDDSDEEEDEPTFTKAFSQIKGDTPAEYAKNLEEAYRNSSKEGRLNAQKLKDAQERNDKIAAIIAKNPEVAKLVNEAADKDETPLTVDPALLHARQAMETQMENDYNSFVKDHPEIETDPDLLDTVLEEVATFGEIARKKGKILSMESALNKAWISLGLNKDDGEKVVTKAKETASKPKTNNGNKKASKKAPMLTEDQIKAGKRMGLTEKQMLDALK